MTKREVGDLTFPFIPSRRRLPLRGSLSSAFGAPLLQGATQQSCKKPTLRKVSSRPSSFRAQREIFLAQRSNEERQMRSSRSTHTILSLPHKYRVPLRHKRSLDYARDDDTRERAISHSLSSAHVEGCSCGAVYPPPSARPFFKGATPLACKSATPKRHFLLDGKVNKMRIPLSPVSSFRAKREIFLAHGKTGLWDGKKQKHPGRHENK